MPAPPDLKTKAFGHGMLSCGIQTLRTNRDTSSKPEFFGKPIRREKEAV